MVEGEELIREIWRRWNAGEREPDDTIMASELEVHSALAGRVFRGEAGLREWMGEIDQQFDSWQLGVDEVLELEPGSLIVHGSIAARGRQSGLDLDQPASWLVGIRDGSRLQTGQLHRARRPGARGGSEQLGEGSPRAGSLRDVSEQRLFDRFVRLCETPSPTGAERAVADYVLAELRELGVEVREDAAAEPARAGAGNLVATVPGRGPGWVSFFAHLDTVPEPGAIEVELVDGVFRSRGPTILGADNKAAVTVLVELAARHAATPAAAGLELVFTVAEEDGLRGAKELDLAALRSSFGYALDHASPIGEVITAAPTYQRVVAEFEGLEAHAGIRPEDGRSAIEAAAAAVGAMRLGRLDPQTTANVGVIRGGVASNVVAGRVPDRVLKRARSTSRRSPARPPRWSMPARGPRPSAAATSTSKSPRSFAATASHRARAPWRSRGARSSAAESSRGRSRPGAAAMRTRSSRAGSTACCSPTGPRPTTRPRRAWPRRGSTEMLAVCEAIAELAAEAPE